MDVKTQTHDAATTDGTLGPASSSCSRDVAETPTQIDPEEASRTAEELWVSGISRMISSPACSAGSHPDACCQRILWEFSRHPRKLEEAIMASAVAHSAQERGVDVQPAWANGAKVFVDDFTAEDLNEPWHANGLRPYHVVLYEADEDALTDALKHLPYGIRKLKPGVGRRSYPDEFALLEVSSGEEDDLETDAAGVIEYTVHNSFLHIGPRYNDRDDRSVRTI
jgi:hypothetical protein